MRVDSDNEEEAGRRALAREKKTGAGLAERDTAYAEGAADIGCLAGGGESK